jgi:hypothetical protein
MTKLAERFERAKALASSVITRFGVSRPGRRGGANSEQKRQVPLRWPTFLRYVFAPTGTFIFQQCTGAVRNDEHRIHDERSLLMLSASPQFSRTNVVIFSLVICAYQIQVDYALLGVISRFA